MNKVEAIRALIREGRQDRGSMTAARRVIRACRALALTDDETVAVLATLDYCDAGGNPFKRYVEGWPLAHRMEVAR